MASSSSPSGVLGLHSKDSEGLRHVEKDVLIPKKMRSKAMVLCNDLVKDLAATFHLVKISEFEDCIRGRTVSAVWRCRKENDRMKECLAKYYNDKEFYEQCKKEYVEEKAKFEETGEKQTMKRTSS